MKRSRDSATDLQELSTLTTDIPSIAHNTLKKPRMSIDAEKRTPSHGQSATAAVIATADGVKAQAPYPPPPPPPHPLALSAESVINLTTTTSSASAPPPAKRIPQLKQTAALKRSVSTPHLHVGTDMSTLSSSRTTPTGTVAGDPADSPDTVEKQRNKLGYHRTSVACGHCRRRKIRCLLAPGDSQGRCTNCIRLKKDCFFFPVDQTTTVEKRSKQGRSGEPASGRLSSASSSTPPPLIPGPLTTQSDPFSQYSSLPSSLPYDFAGQHGSGTGLGLVGADNLSHGIYTHSFDPAEAWDPLYQHRFSMSGQLENLHQDAGQEYWKMSEPQLAAARMAAMQQQRLQQQQHQHRQQHGPAPFGMSSRNEIGWMGSSSSSTQRSLSLGNIGNVAGPYGMPSVPERSSTMSDMKQRHATAAQALGGSSSGALPPSLSTSATSSSTSLSEARSLPLSAPIGSNRGPGLAYFEGWSPYHMQYHFPTPEAKASDAGSAGAGAGYDASSRWYQEPGPLDPVSEDHSEGAPAQHPQLPPQHQQQQHDQAQYFADRYSDVSSFPGPGQQGADYHHHDAFSSG